VRTIISIIILNWNGKHHMKDCLDSVLSQSLSDFEVIVVDNGSKDASQDYIKDNYPQVKLVCLNQNYGFCKGNNEGIKVANGEYIVLLNNDTLVEKDWLNNLYKCMMSEPDLGFCASKIVSYYNRDSIDAAGDGFSICGAGFKRGYLDDASIYMKDEYVFGACAGAAMYKKQMLDEIGLLDEDFFVAYEDSDLSFRAQLAGYKCKFSSEAIVYHKINSTLGKLSDFYVFYGHRNAEYVYFKNMPTRLIYRTFFRHLAYVIIAGFYFTYKGKGLTFIKAKIDFLKNFNEVLVKRRNIQNNRKVSDEYIWNILEKKWLRTRLKGK